MGGGQLQPHTASSSNDDFFSSPEWTSITDPSPALTDSLSFDFDSSCDPSPLLTDFNYEDDEGLAGFANAPLFPPSSSSKDFPLFGEKDNGGSPHQLAFSRSSVDNSTPANPSSNETESNATFNLFRALSSSGLQHINATAQVENATANPLTISTPPKSPLNEVISTPGPSISAPAPAQEPAPPASSVNKAAAAATAVNPAPGNSGRRGTKRRLESSDLLPLDAPIQPRSYKTATSTSRKPTAGSKAGEAEARAIEIEEAKLQKLTDPHAAKRLSNTLAARRSRHRKAEELRTLNETIDSLRGEVEMWKKRCARAEGVSEAELEAEMEVSE